VACGVSRDTIKRRLTDGHFQSATKNEAGRWIIPLDDLLASDLRPGKPAGPDVEVVEDEEDVIDLRMQLAVAKSELASAERVKRAEVEAATARSDGLVGQLKAIEASKADQAQPFEIAQAEAKESANALVQSERESARNEIGTWKRFGVLGWVVALVMLAVVVAGSLIR
jgi:hypothetical protein